MPEGMDSGYPGEMWDCNFLYEFILFSILIGED